MADADDKLDFCKQALGELGTRSTITSLDPPDGSQEAYYCNLFFNSTRDQILRAAHWNFAGRSNTLQLWKALPGTPENPTIPPGYAWSNRDPAPPWLYSYRYQHNDTVQVRRVREQARAGLDSPSVPIYGATGTNYNQFPCVRFEINTDRFDRAGMLVTSTVGVVSFTITAPGTDYRAGDIIYFATDDAPYGQPPALQVTSVNFAGGVVATIAVDAGTFLDGVPGITIHQSSTTGVGTGFTCTVFGMVNNDHITRVILTNARNAMMDYTTSDVVVSEYDPGFADAFMLAFEGKLALALIGDRALYTAKLQEANAAIVNARVRDGNEGLTVYDCVPDWMQARGIAAAGPSGWYNPPYGPLFAV